MLPVVLCGFETWSLTVMVEHRSRGFQNRALSRIEPKKEEVTGGWRRLHNEELHKFYVSPNIIRMMKSQRMSTHGRGEGRGHS
jgi:hypothetical protein